ncbi:hypothetical protein BDQ12DRAFT_406370 [Crucibulum laeve]|uniref:FAD/NAD(P)-binding domain-containing protein n=1 Tax=Crucibulum laeve TaxID=68775 RepID=A0A5C3LQF2_9AGAR|nr:hypothetical protein BDQ12DRAFT_406370 [Crucibulum laeve]
MATRLITLFSSLPLVVNGRDLLLFPIPRKNVCNGSGIGGRNLRTLIILQLLEEGRLVLNSRKRSLINGPGMDRSKYTMFFAISSAEFQSKEVTLIHAEELLLNHVYSRGWRKGLARRLRKRGLNVLLNEQVEDLTPQNGSVTTKNGKTVPTDLVVSVRHTFHSTLVIGCFTNIPCRGGRPNTEFVASLGPGALVESNRVKVTPTLQLFHYPLVLAGGDVIDWYEQKQVAKYGTQRLHDHQKRDCPLGEKISTSDLYWKV